ncbi:MAG: ATP-NAD kinase family protein [Candidatus Methanofastidiosia archaeon]|jgi:predicted polyphosphate/ATP-dependent NAD kinase
MHLFGFVVNPIAGMGGRVGLKGTDNVVEEARKRGAHPVAGERALRTMKTLVKARDILHQHVPIQWVTVSGKMGASILRKAGYSQSDYEIVYTCPDTTTREDTQKVCKIFQSKKVELIVFCGGDGTAHDIYDIVNGDVPMLGIPSGVKMYSGVFGVNPESVAEVVLAYIEGSLRLSEVEIMDLNEELYRKGVWSVKLHGVAKAPFDEAVIQSAKAMIRGPSEKDMKKEIAHYVIEEMDSNIVYILGPGSTVKAIGDELNIDKTLLGIDVIYNKELILKDCNENDLLTILKKYDNTMLIVSPIGAQGFILGRGNLQLSPEVIKEIGIDNIVVVSTPSKLRQIDALRVDTQDKELDLLFKEKKYIKVIIGYHTMAVRTIEVHTRLYA